MNSIVMKRCIGIAIAVALAFACIPLTPVIAEEAPKTEGSSSSGSAAQVANESATKSERIKEEVVYATLEDTGAVKSVYVVNRFDAERGKSVSDYGNYTEVSNLTDDSVLSNDSGKVAIPQTEGAFFYQGTLGKATLPWTFKVAYYLDGKEVAAEDLGGASGDLEIHMSVRANSAADATFIDNYMLQISFTLNGDTCAEITSTGGTAAISGKDRVVSHTVMPGKDADISLSTQVHGFEMSGIQVSAIPYSMTFDVPDTDELVEEMGTLSDAIDALDEGIAKLEQGAWDMSTGSKQLVNGSAAYASGMTQASSGSAAIREGSAQILAALRYIEASLSGESIGDEGFDISDLAKLPENLRRIAAGLGATTEGLAQMRDSYSQMLGQLDGAIATIPTAMISQEDLEALGMAADGNEAATRALNQLLLYYRAGLTISGTYYTVDPNSQMSIQSGLNQMTAGYTSVIESIGAMEGALYLMAQEIEDGLKDMDILEQIEKLKAGLSELTKQYQLFDSGLAEYTEGVDALSSSYTAIHSGLVSMSDGISTYASGVGELHAGSTELNEAVADLPSEMKKEIDDALSEFLSKDFDPVSFVSPKNDSMVSRVQFVMMTDSITAPTEEKAPEAIEEESGFLDKVLALFE